MGNFHNHNRSAIQQRDRLFITRLSEKIVPDTYASLILAMYDELKLDPDVIEKVVLRSQQIWQDASANGWDMKDNCLECTGIDVRYYKTTGNIL